MADEVVCLAHGCAELLSERRHFPEGHGRVIQPAENGGETHATLAKDFHGLGGARDFYAG